MAARDSSFVFEPSKFLSKASDVNESFTSRLSIEEPSDILTESITFPSDPGDSIQYFINQGRAAIDKVRELGNYITSIGEETQFELPVGLSGKNGCSVYKDFCRST